MIGKEREVRGVRNNNLLNIEYHPWNKWRGLDVEEPSDGRFCRFVSPEWGYRAGVRILMSYERRFRTVGRVFCLEEILRDWAPGVENDTERYITVVSRRAKVYRDVALDMGNKELVVRLLEAMTFVECGVAGDLEVIARGYDLAMA